jgi:CheY-like chemotaxis protein
VSDAEEPTADAEALVADVEAEPETQPTAPPAPQPRKSMRDMLFGEEAPAATEAEPTGAASQSEPEPAAADWSWRPTRWEPPEESAWTPEKGSAATEPAAEDQVVEDAPTTEDAPEATPVGEAKEPEPFAPWKSSFASESSESEPAKADTDGAPAVGFPETPAADSGNGSGAGTVVIIEDDETAANYYATLFRGNGYRVEVANDGVSGVDLCTRVQPQVILLDVMMPRQNGILVLQTLRASDETKNTPVVVMSNFSEPTLIKRAIQLGALEYVIKTQVEGSALLNAMPRWINREKAFAAA